MDCARTYLGVVTTDCRFRFLVFHTREKTLTAFAQLVGVAVYVNVKKDSREPAIQVLNNNFCSATSRIFQRTRIGPRFCAFGTGFFYSARPDTHTIRTWAGASIAGGQRTKKAARCARSATSLVPSIGISSGKSRPDPVRNFLFFFLLGAPTMAVIFVRLRGTAAAFLET